MPSSSRLIGRGRRRGIERIASVRLRWRQAQGVSRPDWPGRPELCVQVRLDRAGVTRAALIVHPRQRRRGAVLAIDRAIAVAVIGRAAPGEPGSGHDGQRGHEGGTRSCEGRFHQLVFPELAPRGTPRYFAPAFMRHLLLTLVPLLRPSLPFWQRLGRWSTIAADDPL